MKNVTVNIAIQFDLDGNGTTREQVIQALDKFTTTLQERHGDISPMIFTNSLCDSDIIDESADLIDNVKQYVILSRAGNMGNRFNELESLIEEEIDLPEMDVCAFLEEKFKEELK